MTNARMNPVFEPLAFYPLSAFISSKGKASAQAKGKICRLVGRPGMRKSIIDGNGDALFLQNKDKTYAGFRLEAF